MIKWITVKLKRRFWYSVRLAYNDKNGREIFSLSSMTGQAKKSGILDLREVKKSFHDAMYNKDTKHYMCNGTISIAVNGYLGWLKVPD